MKRRAADIIIQTLAERGIDVCFTVVGGGAMHLDNALGLNKDINKIFCHHEQACSMAADSYARIAEKPAAVCVTSGPGATNAITGVMGAWVDSIPMIVLSGQVRYAISVENSGLPLRYRGIQEFEIVPSVKNMTKYAVMIKDPLSVRREVNKAIDISVSGRRGPVWLDIPLDIQSAVIETEELYPDEPVPAEPSATAEQTASLADELRRAKRPVILAGHGIIGGGCLGKFRSFAEETKLPVIASAWAADIMYSDYDRYYGTCGNIGPRTGNFIVQTADVILSLGCSLGFKTTGFEQGAFAPDAKIIAVDADENEIKKPGIRVDEFIHSTLNAFFDSVNGIGEIPVSSEWTDRCGELKKRFSPFESADGLPDEERVCAYRFWKEFRDAAPDDIVCALGNNTANSAKLQVGVKCAEQRAITNRNCGSMGFDLPAAIGAAAAGRKVVCLTGDGSIMMNLQELQTIKHYGLPIKVVVFENDGYNAIRQTSKNFFGGFAVGCDKETGISFPSFEAVAETFGLKYRCCRSNGELKESLKWLFEEDGNVLLEIKQRLDDPVEPKVMSRQLPDGTMATPALHDMYPFLSEEEMKKWMNI